MFGREWEGITFGFMIAAILALWAVFSILQNREKGNLSKAIWIVAVLCIPFFGFGGWLFFGPKAQKKLN
jgi:Phospholipase_D-nuclease N-terminal